MSSHNTKIFGQVGKLKTSLVNCAMGNLILKDVIDNMGMIRNDKTQLCTKAMLWYYVYYLWSMNKETFPFTEIRSTRLFFKDMTTVVSTYMITKFSYEKVTRYFDRNYQLNRLTKPYIIMFINDTVTKLNHLTIPIVKFPIVKNQNVHSMSKEEILLNNKIENQRNTRDSLIEVISSKIMNPVIKKVISQNKVINAKLTLSRDE